jgi:hypothetical protein
MVSGGYYPDKDIEYDNVVFHLLPNTAIEYKTSVNGQRIVYQLELNSVKLDNHKRVVKEFKIHAINYSVLDGINYQNLYFHPNEIARPSKPSREKYNVYNYELSLLR